MATLRCAIEWRQSSGSTARLRILPLCPLPTAPACAPSLTFLTRASAKQVGSTGEERSAQYILQEMEKLVAEVAANRPDLTAEAVRESVGGRQ